MVKTLQGIIDFVLLVFWAKLRYFFIIIIIIIIIIVIIIATIIIIKTNYPVKAISKIHAKQIKAEYLAHQI